MPVTIRPAVREDTPLIIGLAGPSKSGKTYSAHRVAQGIARVRGGRVIMLNAEGKRGHMYANTFKYEAADIDKPYSYERYVEYLDAIAAEKPGCVIVDSVSHAHDGPGGMLDQHEAELERRAGDDHKKRDRLNFACWIKPKSFENKFTYRAESFDCPIILCFRAKEKLKIVPGKDPVNLGYQPIASDAVPFITTFTLMLPPKSGGVPDMAGSEFRELDGADDILIPGQPLDEGFGERMATWAVGTKMPPPEPISEEQVLQLRTLCTNAGVAEAALCRVAKVPSLAAIAANDYPRALAWIGRQRKEPAE